MKKIMILGAGIYQVPLIRTAQKMGLYTIVSSIPGDYPGFALADKIYYVNTTDHEAILDICRQEMISGICTTGTDVAVSTIGYVCEHMGLNGISWKSSQNVTDKALMKECFRRGNVSTAHFQRAETYEQAAAAAEKLGYPVVLKRVDSSGSRGIMTAGNPSQLPKAYANASKDSSKKYILVEEKINGIEIGVDGIVQNGELVFFAPHEKTVYQAGKITVPVGHSFPFHGSAELIKEIHHQTALAVKSLELDNCAINADVFVDRSNGKVSIIEMGGRTGATCIPELISLYYGFDFYQKILLNALGKASDFIPANKLIPCEARLLMSPVHGTITAIDIQTLQNLQKDHIQICIDHPVGHCVEPMINGTTRIGHVVAPIYDDFSFNQFLDTVYSCIYVDNKALSEIWKSICRHTQEVTCQK